MKKQDMMLLRKINVKSVHSEVKFEFEFIIKNNFLLTKTLVLQKYLFILKLILLTSFRMKFS